MIEPPLLLALTSHVETMWPDSECEIFSWGIGGITESVPEFRVCCVKPSQENKSWTYISLGASQFLNQGQQHVEFCLLSPFESVDHIETLAMVTHYHSDASFRLQVGSVVEIGRPWVEGSNCTHLLVSLPCFAGPKFEECHVQGHLVRLLWLVPITTDEREFLKESGLEALEQEFEKRKIRVSDPYRTSAVSQED